jgi:hypothetical protein
MHLPVGSYLAPFVVARCQPREPALQLHAVLCCSRPGHTAALVKSFCLQQALPEARGELSFAFWSLESRGSEFHESRHGVKQGHVLRFDVGEGSVLPPCIAQGRRYLVTNATDFSFNICGPIISPISPMTSTLAICTMDSNGVADCQTAHYLKPFHFRPCRLRNIPSDCFSPSDNISPALPVLICPNPPDIDKPDCSTFILTHAMHLPVGSYLAPFVVTRCQPSEPALQSHAVLCCSRPGHTAALVKSFRSQEELPEARSEL